MINFVCRGCRFLAALEQSITETLLMGCMPLLVLQGSVHKDRSSPVSSSLLFAQPIVCRFASPSRTFFISFLSAQPCVPKERFHKCINKYMPSVYFCAGVAVADSGALMLLYLSNTLSVMVVLS